jgi:hypothetical protein
MFFVKCNFLNEYTFHFVYADLKPKNPNTFHIQYRFFFVTNTKQYYAYITSGLQYANSFHPLKLEHNAMKHTIYDSINSIVSLNTKMFHLN